ncbi:MAG: molybdopterin-dependent oxidoreductase [Caldithrix sp.]|nr:molybdopterin-dependent oxidoreductase [Caldithrix sp.]
MSPTADHNLHVSGTARFIDDIPVRRDTLYAAVLTSQKAHARITALDTAAAGRQPGIVRIFTAGDIPGDKTIGNIFQDEPLLASDEVVYRGEPLTLIVAETMRAARMARKFINVQYDELPAVFDARQAYDQGRLIAPPRTFVLGDVDKAWPQCDIIVQDRVESGHQEHLYLETQGAYAYMNDHLLKVISSTQSPGAVQKMIARILNIPMHLIEVEAPRLGGAFGGKEEQATNWACLCALAAYNLKRPVKLVLNRREDMNYTGKRHAYTSDFKIGLNRDGKILAYEVFMFQNAGAFADLSTSILERSLFHAANSYDIPNVKATAVSCRTHLPPNTAFRGFGGPQAMFVIEAALDKACHAMAMDKLSIQGKNLLQSDSVFPYGMGAKSDGARRCWQSAMDIYQTDSRQKALTTFNRKNRRFKKGLALMPICFGISFTSKFLNQAGALVHVYNDGSVRISTGAVEMGQGVNDKLRAVAARVFSIDEERILLDTTSTARVANASPTAASTGSDLNGMALKTACEIILSALKQFVARCHDIDDPEQIILNNETVQVNGQSIDLSWDKLIQEAYLERVDLSAHAFYATPHLFFDRQTEKGQPFAYHVYGTGVVEVTVDALTGTYTIDRMGIVHDLGKSLHTQADLGQVEGGVAQGLGWMTMEEIIYSDEGKNCTDTLSTYKIPDIQFMPDDLQVEFIEASGRDSGLFHSKAVGEPPFMYGIGVYFALLNAIRAFRPNAETYYSAPLTPEKALFMLTGQNNKQNVSEKKLTLEKKKY